MKSTTSLVFGDLNKVTNSVNFVQFYCWLFIGIYCECFICGEICIFFIRDEFLVSFVC